MSSVQINEMSKTEKYRKVMKPMLERKRRARINKCLDELKDLIVDSLRKDDEQFVKLEKADILEMTVQHLRKVEKVDPNESFKSGYCQAVNEVCRAMSSLPRVDVNLGTKLMTHLGNRLNQIQKPTITSQLNVKIGTAPYYSSAMMSPASSGYGSECEYSSSSVKTVSTSVWRPW
ncbi:HES6.2 family protein [Megaselia abdita]